MEPQVAPTTRPPVASLVATTEEATLALGGRSEVRVTTLPFRIGRERRVAGSTRPASFDLRRGAAPQLNDVYLLDPPRKHLQVSGEHFAIERAADTFLLLDRGSACGTVVAGTRVGGDRAGGRAALHSGDEIVVGTRRSPYVFRFEVATD